ncbi:hypothetical protein B0H16DRAFT_1579534 [Mycena metata]|uniref:Uncharacterized protein n=1 Tax=Mycena metata TaxID=1033252 RepID=A0AAD7I2C2_9AGAR|nr:hypothetical protein B0H16DRAFT_1579534 [Mycena metata]
MNRTLVRYCARRNPDVGSARNMQIGCGGHVTNLVAQDIAAALGLAPPIAEKDLYEETRKFPLAYDPAEDPVVVAEMAVMKEDIEKGRLEKDVDDTDPSEPDLSESDVDDAENPEDTEDLWVLEAEEEEEEAPAPPPMLTAAVKPTASGKGKRKAKKVKPPKLFTPVDKIHETVVHILRSEIRRKKARVLIHKLADKEYRHLVFVRSMVIRWNTMYAEMRRARQLAPALDAFVADMPRGLTGKKKAAAVAKKKKWEMHSSDWEYIDKLMSALEVLQNVTLEFSKKGTVKSRSTIY